MELEKKLEKYEDAVQAIKDHIAQNKSVFDSHEKLVMAQIQAESDLRDAVQEAETGVSDGMYNVTFEKQTQTFGDVEAIEKLIAGGAIHKTLKGSIIKTVSRPPKILIKPLRF